MTHTKSETSHRAIAERINGIIKCEFGFIKKLPSMEVAQKMITQAVEIYNNQRRLGGTPHKSLNMKTPAQAHRENNHQHKFYKKLKNPKLNYLPKFFKLFLRIFFIFTK